MEVDEDAAADTSFTLMCYHIDYTGSEFCAVTQTFEIKPFRGELSIDDLSIYPIRFRRDAKGYLDIVETGSYHDRFWLRREQCFGIFLP